MTEVEAVVETQAEELKPRTMSEAFDEWMRRYEEEPERFTREFQDVQRFIEEGGREGKPTSYGTDCEEMLRRLMEGK